MTFLTMLAIILLSTLMMLCIGSVETTRISLWIWIWCLRDCWLSRKWLVDFNAGKNQLLSFDRFTNSGTIDVRMDLSVLEEKLFFKMLGLTFSSKLDWGSYVNSITKTSSKKIGSLILFCEVSFSWGCSVSLYIYHATMHGILFSCLGWCS